MKKLHFDDGVHDISSSEYHNSDAVSRSALSHLNKSARHFFYEFFDENKEEKEQSDAMIFGNLFHTLLLEPHLIYDQYAVMPSIEKLPPELRLKDVGREAFDKSKADRKAAQERNQAIKDAFESNSQGKIIIDEEDLNTAKEMANAVLSDRLCADLILDAKYEQSIFWTDKETGIQFKARPDIWHPHMIVDIKTTKDASYNAFQRSAVNHMYYLQAAMMREACDAIELPFERFVFLAVEKTKPFAQGIYPIDEWAIEFGLDLFNILKRKLVVCKEKQEWPSYPIRDLTIPNWAKNILIDEE